MSFFQNSVLEKYLKNQDTKAVKSAYEQFTTYFHNSEIQQNIRNSKEEQFQEGFLRELFVKIFGYTLNPNPNFNLTTEFKNEKGAKKADGAILTMGLIPLPQQITMGLIPLPQQITMGLIPLSEPKAMGLISLSEPKAIAVIELKGTDTKDLEKINQQAFNYKNNHKDCVYVITSNFEKLRFYIHHSVEYLEFNLFKLNEVDFQLLWLCLSAENLLNGVPLKVKEESLLEEENVTKKLYKDYATFRTDLWQNMVKNNSETDKLLLFKKTQKLLDRFLFIFFAEDSGLLPPNSISRIVQRWELLRAEDAYKPLYHIFKQYFGYINIGRKGKKEIDDIFAYNGGLFQPDEILDRITIDDALLYSHVMKLTNYDFRSEVDVNILGHIFENSLNEIENITASLSTMGFIPLSNIETTSATTMGLIPLSNKISKRKKDGVFYTPKYITKYIVENTVGKLCEEKKIKLGIIDEEFAKGRKNRKAEIIKKLDTKLQEYRNWLLNISICDPACGSGAFLNQALEFLINEHAYIDELQAQLFGSSLVFQDVSNHILENNIFGVDINEESVDIAKLSLWLRTAQRGRKLTSLNNNIKCGNSLIDDPKVAGEKAFNWQKEFPTVFQEKKKKAYHITTATHDSRTSQRMVDFKVREKRDNGLRPKAQPIWLEADDEILIIKTISEIVVEDNLNVMAMNICGDHLHILLVCEEEEVDNIVGKLKGRASRMYNINKGINPLVQKEGEKSVSLWTQKFGRTPITDDKQLWNTIEYIKNNRTKHELPENNGINPIVEKVICDYDHAFRTEYKGGFDVVIGNPPYGAKISKFDLDFIIDRHKDFGISSSLSDTYFSFYALSLKNLLKNEGYLGFITPNTWKLIESAQNFRNTISSKPFWLCQIIQHQEKVFADATVDCDTLIIKKTNNLSDIEIIIKNQYGIIKQHSLNQETLSSQKFFNLFLTQKDYELKEKINKSSSLISENFVIKNGVKPYEKGKGKPVQTEQIMQEKPFTSEIKKDESFSPLIGGSSFNKYSLLWKNDYWIQYGEWLAAPRDKEIFEVSEKLIFRQTSDSIIGTLIAKGFIIRDNTHIIFNKVDSIFDLKYVLALLNSTLTNWYYWTINPEKGEAMAQVKAFHLGMLPFKAISKLQQQPFIEKADLMLNLNTEFQKVTSVFSSLLQSKYEIEKLNNKLQNWHELEFKEFLQELGKVFKTRGLIPLHKQSTRGLIPLSLKAEAEWMQYFNEQKQKAQEIKTQISQTDKEIDRMVYELYGLNEEEIRIVEGS